MYDDIVVCAKFVFVTLKFLNQVTCQNLENGTSSCNPHTKVILKGLIPFQELRVIFALSSIEPTKLNDPYLILVYSH